jgi:hypothetical protein
MTESVGQCLVGEVVEAPSGYDRNVVSPGPRSLRRLGLEPGHKLALPLGLFI